MEVIRVPLKGGLISLMDAADYEYLKGLGLTAAKRECGLWYVVTAEMKLVHRIIMDAPAGLYVDHINDNGLDNRRCNLRLCTNQENIRKARHPLGASGYRGVRLTNRKNPWRAIIQVAPNKKVSLGYFATKEEAARAYDTAAKQFFGPFARLNFPNEHQLPPLTEIAKEPVRCLPDYGKNFP